MKFKKTAMANKIKLWIRLHGFYIGIGEVCCDYCGLNNCAELVNKFKIKYDKSDSYVTIDGMSHCVIPFLNDEEFNKLLRQKP